MHLIYVSQGGDGMHRKKREDEDYHPWTKVPGLQQFQIELFSGLAVSSCGATLIS